MIGVGAVAPTVLAACGGDDTPATTAAAPATTAAAPATTAAATAEATTTTAMMDDAPAEFESITLAQVGGWISLDNNRTTAGALASGQHNFEGLLIKLPDRSLIPGLAAEMPQQVDGTTYSVKVRTDRTFTDGSPIKASDIAYGFDRLAPERELGSPFTAYISFIESVEVVAADELRFNLTQPIPEDVLFQRISGINAYPEAVVEAMGGMDYSFAPTPSSGSMMVDGPFDTEINTFKRYDGYEGPMPLAAKDITYLVIPELSGRIAQAEAGQVQILDGVSPQLYRAIEDSPNLSLGVARETTFLEMIFFNTTKPPFDNQLVRQAVMYSIDAPQLIEIGLAGEGRIARSPLPPESDRYREPQMQYNYDPEKSKELLREAGYDPDNAPVQFQLGVVEWAYVYPQAPLFAQTMQLGGFDPLLLVDSIDARWVSDIMRPEDGGPARYDAWVATIGFEVFTYDPDNLFRGWWGGWAENASFATENVPSTLNDLLDQALEEPDFDKQNDLYAAANEILVTEAGAVPILFQPIAHAWHKSVAGYQMPQTLGMTMFGVHPSGM
jgi:peptide/nickel transport system substrate-binding protein